jgi:hypothetical protein
MALLITPRIGHRRRAAGAKGVAARNRAFSSESCPALDAGWLPVRVKKTRQNRNLRNLEPRSDSIGTDKGSRPAGKGSGRAPIRGGGGVVRGLRGPRLRRRGRASKNRNVSVGRRRLHKNVIQEQRFIRVFCPVEPLFPCVQFCNTLRKNNETRALEAFFQLRFGGREVILNPSREAMHIFT